MFYLQNIVENNLNMLKLFFAFKYLIPKQILSEWYD